MVSLRVFIRKIASVPGTQKADSGLYGFAVAITLVVYGNVSSGTGIDHLGFLDNIIYLLLFFFLFSLLTMIRRNWLRIVALGMFFLINILLAWGNLIYFRFFKIFAPVEVLLQWQDARFAIRAAPLLIRWPDILFMLAAPVVLTLCAIRTVGSSNVDTAKLKRLFLLVPLIAVAFFVHWSHGDYYSFKMNQINPIIDMPRQLLVKRAVERMAMEANMVSNAMISAGSIYENCGDPQYLLLKKPKKGFQPLYQWQGRNPNIVLIIVESLQASEMGAYNDGRRSYTPNLDLMAAQGLKFSNFYSNGSMSQGGEMAILSSLYQDVRTGRRRLKVRTKGMPAYLKEVGYSTLSVSGFNEAVDLDSRKSLGIDEQYGTVPSQYQKVGVVGLGPADEDLFDYALALMSARTEPFFAEILTLSSHADSFKVLPSYVPTTTAEGDDRYKEYSSGYYYADYAIGRFMRQAREMDFYKNTIFVITADHGASIMAGGTDSHQLLIREWFRRVPFIIYAPGMIAPAVINTPGSQLDVAPTILDILDIHKITHFNGQSLLRPIPADRQIYMPIHGPQQGSIRIGNNYCYLKSIAGGETVVRPFLDHADKDDYFCFEYSGDLLLTDGDLSGLSPLSPSRRERLISTIRGLSGLSHYLSRNDLIWPDHGVDQKCGVKKAISSH